MLTLSAAAPLGDAWVLQLFIEGENWSSIDLSRKLANSRPSRKWSDSPSTPLGGERGFRQRWHPPSEVHLPTPHFIGWKRFLASTAKLPIENLQNTVLSRRPLKQSIKQQSPRTHHTSARPNRRDISDKTAFFFLPTTPIKNSHQQHIRSGVRTCSSLFLTPDCDCRHTSRPHPATPETPTPNN